MKKDLNWFKEQLDDIEMNTPMLWSHTSIWMLDKVNELLDQLDEPETFEQTLHLLESTLKENKRLGNLLEEKHEEWLDLMDIINNRETENLSPKWIESNSVYASSDGATEEYVHVDDLQNLLVPKQELPVVPKWFDEWWKDVAKGAGSLFHNIDRVYDELFSSGTREMNNYISSPDNKQKLLNIIINELDYVVEEEQKYIIKIGNLYLAEPLGDMTSDIVRMTRDKGVAYQFTDEKSIATHLDKFEGTFAVKVEELEG